MKKETGQEAVKSALRIIESWEGVVRDLFLLNFGQNDLVQYDSVITFFNKEKNSFKLKDLLDISLKLRESKKYLRANVNPLLVLENIAIGI